MADYRLTLNKEQAHVLIKALDFFSRVKVGQLKEIGWVLRMAICNGERPQPSTEDTTLADQLLDKVQMLYFPELGSTNASYGIREAPGEDEKIAYDIQQVVRHRLAWDDVKPGEKPRGVWGHDPWKTSKTQPLPNIDSLSPLEQLAAEAPPTKKRRRKATK